MAVIVAQAMNHGNHVMARTSDIPFHVLETTYEQYLRLASLVTANDCITMPLRHCRFSRTIRLIRKRFMVPLTGKILASSD